MGGKNWPLIPDRALDLLPVYVREPFDVRPWHTEVVADASDRGVALRLPKASEYAHRTLLLRATSLAHAVAAYPFEGTATIEGASVFTLTSVDVLHAFVCDGSAWKVHRLLTEADRTATPTAFKTPIANANGELAEKWTASAVARGRVVQLFKDPGVGAVTWTSIGMGTPTASVTPTSIDGANGCAGRFTTGTTAGDTAEFYSGDFTRIGWDGEYFAQFNVGNNLGGYRLWAALATASLAGVATPTTQQLVGISIDTTRDGSGQPWQLCSCDGTTPTLTPSLVTPTAAQEVLVRWKTAFNLVSLYVNDTLLGSISSTLPGVGSYLRLLVGCANLAGGSARRVDVYRFGGVIPT